MSSPAKVEKDKGGDVVEEGEIRSSSKEKKRDKERESRGRDSKERSSRASVGRESREKEPRNGDIMGPPGSRSDRSSVRRSQDRDSVRRSQDRDSSDRDIKRRRGDQERERGREKEKSPPKPDTGKTFWSQKNGNSQLNIFYYIFHKRRVYSFST